MPADAPAAADSVEIRAAGTGEFADVVRTRSRCYARGYADKVIGDESAVEDPWGDAAAGDYLLATRRGRTVGTLTALSGRIAVRGTPLPCQGVAWVGTAHDARRSGGVATKLMGRCLQIAREREQVVSALMPFRASFYEKFGYGLVERRALWTIPIPLLPTAGGDGEPGFELVDLDDAAEVAAVAACRSRQVDAGHGDLAFAGPLDGFGVTVARCRREGYLFARRDSGDPSKIGAFVRTQPVGERGNLGLLCPLIGYATADEFAAVLRFLATLRDQYSFVQVATPAELPLNRLLREPQLPHRGVEHAYATCELATRMQLRILDHARFFDETLWPDAAAAGRATVAVREPEGTLSRFALDVTGGRCDAKSIRAASTDFACSAATWAAVATGDLRASSAAELGVADAAAGESLRLLDTLSAGPPPFCREYF